MKTRRKAVLSAFLCLVVGLIIGNAISPYILHSEKRTAYDERLRDVQAVYTDDGTALRITAVQPLWQGESDESRINLELQGISYGSSPVRVTFDKPDSPVGNPVYSLYIQDVHVQPDAVLRIWYADSQDKVLAERTVSLRADDGR